MTVCANKIVGVSETATPCLNLEVVSPLSGLYLDDMSPGKLPLNPAFYSSVELAEKTLLNAASEVETKVLLSLNSRLAKIHSYTEATIGFSDTYTGFSSVFSGYRYVVLRPKSGKGTTIKITSLAVYLNTGLFAGEIHIYQNGESKFSGLMTEFTGLELNLTKPIYIAYTTENRPRDFLTTPCCGQYIRHSRYVDVSSGMVDNLSELGMNLVYSNLAQGIEIGATFDCDPFFNLCSIDFKKNSFGIIYAKLIQQVARLSIGMKILSDNTISSYSLVRRDEINNINEYLSNDIEVMYRAIPEYYNNSDCYTCTGMYLDNIEI